MWGREELRGLDWYKGDERWYVAVKPLYFWPALGKPIKPLCALGQVSSQLKAVPHCIPLKD